MKRKTFWSFFIPILFLFACESKRGVVEFKDLGSYIMVSFEKYNSLVFRSAILPKSYVVITKYNFYKENENKYILTLTEEAGDKKPVKEINYVPDGYIEVTIPVDKFDLKNDRIFYKDLNGEHPIAVGKKADWDKYLKDEKMR